MKPCRHPDCVVPPEPDQDHCPLHNPSFEKDPSTFAKSLHEYSDLMVKSKGNVALESVVFPRSLCHLPPFFDNIGITDPNLRNLELNGCSASQMLKIDGGQFSEVHIRNCEIPKLEIRATEARSLRLADNEVEHVEIVGSRFENLYFGTYLVAGVECPTIKHLLIVSVELNNLEIHNLPLHSVNLRDLLITKGISVFGIEPSSFLMFGCGISQGKIHEVRSESFIIAMCSFTHPSNLTIYGCKLQNSSFPHTQVSELSFVDNDWRGNLKDKILLRDHQMLLGVEVTETHGGHPVATIGQCAETYRQLKANFESRGNYIDAGDFHWGEMEMRRLAGLYGRNAKALERTKPWRCLNLYSAYRFLSGYGESPSRAALVFLVGFVVCTALHLLAGFGWNSEMINYDLSVAGPWGFPDAGEIVAAARLAFSHLTLRSVGQPAAAPNILNTILWAAETILGPLQIGLIALAIRRRVHR